MKYFTPNLEDLFIGYELERILPDYSKHINHPNTEAYEQYCLSDKRESTTHILSKEDLIPLLQFDGDLRYGKGLPIVGFYRTPYLDKAQIEAEGWAELKYKSGKYDGRLAFEKGNYFAILHENKDTKLKGRICILLKDVTLDPYTIFTSNGQIFLGECFSINEFRYIIKLLGI